MFLKREPALWTAAFSALINFTVLMEWVELTGQQLAGANMAFAAVLGLIVRQAVTPNVKVGAEDDQDV